MMFIRCRWRALFTEPTTGSAPIQNAHSVIARSKSLPALNESDGGCRPTVAPHPSAVSVSVGDSMTSIATHRASSGKRRRWYATVISRFTFASLRTRSTP
jgi:hypothetical protein